MEPQDRFETVGVEREGHLTWLTLDRPESLNAMNAALVRELVPSEAPHQGDALHGRRCRAIDSAALQR